MPIKTFRGLIAAGGQDTIVLHTNDGSMGYRIKNFQVIGQNVGSNNYEAVVKIWKVPQTTVTGTIDFSEQTLLGVIFYTAHSSAQSYPTTTTVIFDKEIFNQDIYITNYDGQNYASNYYIELEQVKLNLNENTVATLKDIRNLA